MSPQAVTKPFATKEVIEDSAIGFLMDIGMLQIHPIAFNPSRQCADEEHGSIGLDLLHHADMRERIIGYAVSIEIPGVMKKNQIPRMNGRAIVNPPVFDHMGVNAPYPISAVQFSQSTIQVDTL